MLRQEAERAEFEKVKLEEEIEMLRQAVEGAEMEAIRLQEESTLEEQRDRYFLDE